jgi:4'-phosphopantetheinyl transferase
MRIPLEKRSADREYRNPAVNRTQQQRLEGEVHIWIQRLTGLTSPGQLDGLSDAERQRANDIRHPRVSEHFAAGRLLARHALSQYADVEPHDWLFEATPDGRPEIASPQTESPLRFNLSHTDSLVVCVVTDGADCGVDLEGLDRRIDMMGIAAHSFDPEEVKTLEDLETGDLSRRFFALWTLKEAYLKAVGSGIRLRLDAVRFAAHQNGTIEHWISGADRSLNQEWQFALFAPDAAHYLAVAVRAGEHDEYGYRCWEVAGGGDDEASPSSATETLAEPPAASLPVPLAVRPVELKPIAVTARHS